MTLFAGALVPNVKPQFFTEDGVPVAGGFLYSFVAGTTTPLSTFTDSELTPGQENTNPIELDAGGYPPHSIFLQATGYKFRLLNASLVQLWEVDDVESPGQVFATNFGVIQSQGSKNTVSGYTLLATDRFVTVSSTGGANPCLFNLLPAQTATQAVYVMNLGSIDVAITPNGADTINSVAAAYTLAAGTTPVFASVLLLPDGVSNWGALLFAS